MNLKGRVAKKIADEVELKLFEGLKSTFEYDYDDCDPEIQTSQDFYLRLADKIILQVKRDLKK